MSIKKLVLRGCGLLIPALGALHTAGCGGTAFSDGGSGGAAGSAIGAAGSGVSGNGGSAGTGAGGASGGSAGGCSGVSACPAVACAMGWTSVTKPGDCCPTCVPSGEAGAGGSGGCAGAGACPAIDCIQGYTLEQTAGACCPTCVPDANACTQGQQGYEALRQKLLQASGVLACKVTSDCTTLSGNAYCGDECAATPVNVTSAPGINNQLSSYATDNCSTCTPEYPPCAAPLPPACENGFCVNSGVVTAG
jgi:hypothetical protein